MIDKATREAWRKRIAAFRANGEGYAVDVDLERTLDALEAAEAENALYRMEADSMRTLARQLAETLERIEGGEDSCQFDSEEGCDNFCKATARAALASARAAGVLDDKAGGR